MRDLKTGTKTNERYRTQETVERVQLDEKEMQFLFVDGNLATFMDNKIVRATHGRPRVDRRAGGFPDRGHDLRDQAL